MLKTVLCRTISVIRGLQSNYKIIVMIGIFESLLSLIVSRGQPLTDFIRDIITNVNNKSFNEMTLRLLAYILVLTFFYAGILGMLKKAHTVGCVYFADFLKGIKSNCVKIILLLFSVLFPLNLIFDFINSLIPPHGIINYMLAFLLTLVKTTAFIVACCISIAEKKKAIVGFIKSNAIELMTLILVLDILISPLYYYFSSNLASSLLMSGDEGIKFGFFDIITGIHYPIWASLLDWIYKVILTSFLYYYISTSFYSESKGVSIYEVKEEREK